MNEAKKKRRLFSTGSLGLPKVIQNLNLSDVVEPKRRKKELDQTDISIRYNFSYKDPSVPALPIMNHTQQILTELSRNNIIIIQGMNIRMRFGLGFLFLGHFGLGS